MRLSAAAHSKLVEERTLLVNIKLPEVLALVDESRTAGDISQNPDYFVAAEAEGQIRSRLAKVEEVLAAHEKAVSAGDPAPSADTVVAGVTFTVDFGGGDEESYLFGSIEESTVSALDVVTVESPMGRAVAGAGVGSTVAWTTQSGGTISATVVSIALT